uniref:Uncharacterized protein n=1 Tax=Triticum urartu TaxID=4572 RepID=A0A8R7TB72_TRIUA
PNLSSSPWRLAREDPDPLERGCGGHAPAEESSSSSDTTASAPSSFNPLVPCHVQPPHTPLLAPGRNPSQRAALADEVATRRRCSAGLTPPRPRQCLLGVWRGPKDKMLQSGEDRAKGPKFVYLLPSLVPSRGEARDKLLRFGEDAHHLLLPRVVPLVFRAQQLMVICPKQNC